MRTTAFIVLLTADIMLLVVCWLISPYVLPVHCLGTFRVRNITVEGPGGRYGIEQYGLYDATGAPQPMTTLIHLGPLGEFDETTLGRWSFAILAASVFHAVGRVGLRHKEIMRDNRSMV